MLKLIEIEELYFFLRFTYLFERVTQKETTTENFHGLVHSPDQHNGQAWDLPEPGASSTSSMWAGAQALGPSSGSFLGL